MRSFILSCFVAVLALSSCSDDTNTTPPPSDATIELDTAGVMLVYAVGDPVSVNFTVKVTDTKVEKIEVLKGLTTLDEIVSGVKKGYSGKVDDVVEMADLGTVTYTVKVTDEDDQQTLASFDVTVIEPGNALTVVDSVTLAAQNLHGTGSFYAVTEDSVFTIDSAKVNSALIDMVYYYGSTNKATICAPADTTVNGGTGNLSLCADFETKNATLFVLNNTLDFDNVKRDVDLKNVEPTESKITNLKAGDIIVFKTTSDEKGIIKVMEIEESNDGTMKMKLKVK